MAQRSWWVRGVVLGGALLLAPVGAWADKLTELEQAFETQQKSLQQLQQEMHRLRQERTVQQEEVTRRVMEVEKKAAEAAASSFLTGMDPWPGKGFYLKSPDGQHRLSIGGYIQALTQVEGALSDDVEGNAAAINRHNPSTFKLHRVRLILNGQLYKDFGFHVETQLADGPTKSSNSSGGAAGTSGGTRLEWAVGTYTYAPWAKIAVGQMRNHYGLEMAMATQDLDFASQRSLVSRALSPDLQLGLHVSGDLKQFVGIPFYYGAGIFNGCGRVDQCPGSIDNDGEKEYTGRLAVTPPMPFGNLTIGVNGDYRKFDMKGSANTKGAFDLATSPVNGTIYHNFNPTSVTGVALAGSGFRINGERITSGADLYYEFYPFFIRGEYHYALQERDSLSGTGNNLDDLIMQGGYGTLGFWIFGNKLKGLVLAGRYEQLRIDDDSGKFDPATTGEVGTDIRAVTTGLTWHINPNIWLRGNYVYHNVSPHQNIAGMSSSSGGGEAHQGIAEFMLRF
ncbi:porin [Candidatus Methylomirabilis sp.]|uniref:OprO/OprP family phosphate-selective porin n=1 Tax=Candidatus Methylomirabilis tolerans TaxID=3123416 RepID=A0AAJ1AFI4_9BACT|nr:OprO/OprP family phosphate-selective porin [Candidatus Methylomirabilis sp.]